MATATPPTAAIEWLLPLFATPVLLVELALCAVCGGRRLRRLYVLIVTLSISVSLLFLYDTLKPNRAVLSKFNTYEYGKWATPRAVLPYTAVVRTKTAALNPADHKIFNHLALVPFARWFMPHSPGFDLAGVVTEVGPMCTNIKPGDEVFAAGLGALREYSLILCPAAGKLPKGVDFIHGTAGLSGGITALTGFENGNLKKGETLLVIGSSGACGQSAVIAAKLHYKPKEIGCIASGKNREVSLKLGCDKFFDYTSPNFREELLSYYKDGVDFVYDTVSEPFPLHGPYVEWLLPKTNRLYETLNPSIDAKLSDHRSKHYAFSAGVASINFLETHADMFNKVTVSKVVDAFADIKNVIDAYDLLKTHRAVGKIVLTLDSNLKRSN